MEGSEIIPTQKETMSNPFEDNINGEEEDDDEEYNEKSQILGMTIN